MKITLQNRGTPPKAWQGWRRTVFLLRWAGTLAAGGLLGFAGRAVPVSTVVRSLDGPNWSLAPDPKNAGRTEQWWEKPAPGTKTTKVPWIIQDAFPGYHGVAWYWRDFVAPTNPHPGGQSLLRFWAADYKADVWLNGVPVGGHEGGESPFVLDVTAAFRPGVTNRLAVRILNPTHQPIDGIVLNETPHRNKTLPYAAGNAWDQGGLIDSVELVLTPAVRVADLFVRPDWKSGRLRLQANLHNAAPKAARVQLEFSVAPATGGETAAVLRRETELPPGDTPFEAELRVEGPRLWQLNDPFLYRVSARVRAEGSESFDESSVRCGFRDFRFENGFFRLNGRRLFLRCSHTGNCCPIGLELPYDPDWLRRDLLNVKVMGFNAIRFISGVARRYQLDLCDELGLLVYEEPYAAWCLAPSPQMAARYDESLFGMVRRDRNHPAVALWGLLNETSDGAIFRHALSRLPALRTLDDSRVVMLNSGRWDSQAGDTAGLEAWRNADRPDPCVTRNPTTRAIKALGITWAPGQLAFHPGRNGEYGVVRWTAPAEESVRISAVFTSIAEKATTDVHLLHNGQSLHDDLINLQGRGRESRFQKSAVVKKGDTLDCVVGFGNGDYGADTTALAVRIQSERGQTWDAAPEFSVQRNPNGAWSYGQLPPSAKPEVSRLALFSVGVTEGSIGTLSNPDSTVWEDVLADQHPYQRVPHTADIIAKLRTLSDSRNPLFISEYGIGSAVDLCRVTRHYERLEATHAEDAKYYRDKLDRFMADWERWRMAEAFGRPEDFFAASLRRMAGQRLLGLNAIRSNPKVVGHSLTGTVDQGMTAEGLFTTFRELKPGTVDAVFDGLAPLRWCLFVEPVHFYRGTRARLEAVLADEDTLAPGDYPIRLEVFGPDNHPIWSARTNLVIHADVASSFARAVFAAEVVLDGPAGKYRFVATMEKGAAPAGGESEFFIADPSELAPVDTEIVSWGEDPVLTAWLKDRHIRQRPFAATTSAGREVILAGTRPPAPGGAEVFRGLARRLAQGSTVVFLAPEIFARDGHAAGWVPLAQKGSLSGLNSWLYHKDEWAKPHPVFAGLPTGLLDYTFYRELIPDRAWVGQAIPAEAVCGANDASIAYASGLMVAVHSFGAGKFILNTLRIRENLGRQPAADRLLVNLLRYAARDSRAPASDLPEDFEDRLKAIGYR
jgi:hypothetical protein